MVTLIESTNREQTAINPGVVFNSRSPIFAMGLYLSSLLLSVYSSRGKDLRSFSAELLENAKLLLNCVYNKIRDNNYCFHCLLAQLIKISYRLGPQLPVSEYCPLKLITSIRV